MATFTRTRVARTAVAVVASPVLLGFTLPGTAHAVVDTDPVTASFVKLGAGLDGVVPHKDGTRRPAGSIIVKLPDGTELETFCLEFGEPTDKGNYTATTWGGSPVDPAVLAKAAYIAEHHETIGTKYAKVNYENAAAQVAIWELTNPKQVDADKLGNKEFAKRVNQLTKAANATAVSAEPALSYSLTGAKSTLGEGEELRNVVSGKLTLADGTPVAAAQVAFVVNGERQVTETDAEGVASIEVPRAETEQTVSLEFVSAVPAGTVLLPSDETKQAVIAGDGFEVLEQASLTLAAADPIPTEEPEPTKEPAPKPEPKPEPEPKPAPEPQKPAVPVPDTLPKTGAGELGALVAGALALGGAGFAGLRRMRRR